MKGRFFTILTAFFLLGIAPAQAQLYIGPSLSGGLTYGSNFIISDTSQYHIAPSGGLYFSGGLDILYAFDENIRLQIGGQFRSKSYKLEGGTDGNPFSMERNVTSISIPMAFHYRIPFGSSGKTYLNFMAGHSLDIYSGDSTVLKTADMLVDSAGSFGRYEFVTNNQIIPTVLLGVGADYEMGNGSILNLSLVWGIGTGRILQGNLSQWDVLNQAFDPNELDVPEEFPETYHDYAMRGNYLSLRIGYWFNLSNLGKKDDGGDELMEDE